MIFLDSDCIIDFLRGDEKAIEIVGNNLGEVVTSELNSFEVFFGIFNKRDIPRNELLSAEKFFEVVNVLSFDSQCGKISAKILCDLKKKGVEINQNDCLIASIMMKNGIDTIITRNKKHFSKVKGLMVLEY